MDGGHGDSIVLLLPDWAPAEAEGTQVTLEVAVQEAVEDRVDTHRAHGSQVAE